MGPGPEPEPISFSACSCLSLLPPSFCLSPHPSHLVFLSLGSSPAGVSDHLRLTISLKPSSTFQPNIKALSLLPSPTPPPPGSHLAPGAPCAPFQTSLQPPSAFLLPALCSLLIPPLHLELPPSCLSKSSHPRGPLLASWPFQQGLGCSTCLLLPAQVAVIKVMPAPLRTHGAQWAP